MSENVIAFPGFKIGLFSGPAALKPLPAALKPLWPLATFLTVDDGFSFWGLSSLFVLFPSLPSVFGVIVTFASLLSPTIFLSFSTSVFSFGTLFTEVACSSLFSLTGEDTEWLLVISVTFGFSTFSLISDKTLSLFVTSVIFGFVKTGFISSSLFSFFGSVKTGFVSCNLFSTLGSSFADSLMGSVLVLFDTTTSLGIWGATISAAWTLIPVKKKNPDNTATLATPILYLRIL